MTFPTSKIGVRINMQSESMQYQMLRLILGAAVGNAMDDCIDSGTGPGGNLTIRDTYIESCYHEGIALSDNGFDIPKTVRIEHVIVEDCQQGIELGFSTHLHTISVKNVSITRILFTR